MRTLAPALLVAALVVTGCGDDDVAAPSPLPTEPVASPSASPPATPSASPSAGTTARAVYWLGAADDPRGPRLYREFVARPADADPVRDAVELMLAGEPSDPDYTSLWADGTTLLDVTTEGTAAVVDLSAQATTNGGGSAFEAFTLQQLVHTVTAADPALTEVRLQVEGEPVETLWGATDAAGPLRRDEAASTLGPVWLDVPEGGTIDGAFGGSATVFEATVSWELRQGDRVVQEGFSTATTGAPERGEWTAEADVPAGDYELWAYESSARDGSITWLDTKSVTVES